jgi:hypothetical protein
MAVFPDRIVLKNSTDDQATIEAAIQTGGTDEITQGEIVLGINTTNVKFYTKAGDGSIVTLGGTTISTLGDLADVDLSTPATDGQVIAYNATSGNWEPVDQSGGGLSNVVEDATPQLGGNLDVNSFYISSAGGGDIQIAPDTTGDFIVRGNSTDGSITLNCTANTHGVKIQSPPHSDAATYTLILPSSAGTAGQVLTSQGGAQLTWENAGSGGATSIDDLTDVDTATTPPTNDQALTWDGTNWVPGDVTGGAVDSVNGETGVVSLGIQDMDDFGLAPDPAANIFTLIGPRSTNPTASGQWGVGSGLNNYFTWFDTDPVNTYLSSLSIGSTVEFVTEGGYVHSAVTSSTATNNGANSDYISFAGYPWPQEILDANTNNESIVVREPGAGFLPPSNSQVLTWIAANNQWEPSDLQAEAVRAALGIGEYTDDAAAGTGGVVSGAMYYNTTSSDYRLKT